MAKIPFDVKWKPQIESGEYKVFAHEHEEQEVRIVCWDNKGEFPIVALIDNEPEKFDKHGRVPGGNCGGEFSLFIVTPEPELSAFEDALKDCVNMRRPENPMTDEGARNNATILRAIAFDEFKENEASYMKEAYERGKAEALRTRATEFTKNLATSGLDKDSIPYHLIEFMCNLYDSQNWKEIEDTAELYVTRIKAAALQDLPRWKECEEYTIRNYGKEHVEYRGDGHYLVAKGMEILVSDLEKLPGFKED